MNNAVINIKINSEDKKAAQRVAEQLGIPLSVILKGFLKQLIRTQTINFSNSEEPSEFLINSLNAAQKDVKEGRVSPTFKQPKDASAWLNDPHRDDGN